MLVVVPPSEALDWDLKDEVASTARCWIAEREAWWVAAPYASTAVAIATRFNGGRPPLEGRLVHSAVPCFRRLALAGGGRLAAVTMTMCRSVA